MTAMPGYLQSYTEASNPSGGASTGCVVTRVTGDPGDVIPNLNSRGGRWSWCARHHYSVDSPFNADGTMICINRFRFGGHQLILDGTTLEVLAQFPQVPGESRWHPVWPDTRIYLDTNEIGYLNPIKNTRHEWTKFSNYQLSFNGKGNGSTDGRYIICQGTNASGLNCWFVYDIQQGVKSPDVLTGTTDSGQYATMSPSGTYVIWNNGTSDVATVYVNTGTVASPNWTTAYAAFEAANPSHYDVGINVAGEEVIVGKSNNASHSQQLVMRRLSDGLLTEVKGPAAAPLYCMHASCQNVNRPGWAYLSHCSYGIYTGWTIAVKLDTSQTIDAICQTPYPSVGGQYDDEPQYCPNRDGSQGIFASNWANNAASFPVYAFHASKATVG